MSRHGDYRSFYLLLKMLIGATIGILFFLFRFLKNVYKYNLWGELAKSLLISFVYLAIVSGVSQSSEEIAGFLVLAGLIYFCYWWNGKFNYADTRINSSNWKEQAWWWTLDGWQFEQEVARVFRLNGYNATVTKGSGDGGVDIILKKENYKAIVQCKHHHTPLSPEPVRALWGIKDDWSADEVIMVASSGLTSASSEFVRNKPNYKVLNLDDIIKMSQQALNQPKPITKVTIQHKPKQKAITGRKLDI